MNNYIISKDMTVTKTKNAIKANMTDFIVEKMSETFGEDNVKMVRIGATPKNILAVRIGTVEEGGFTYDACITVDVSAKDFKDRETSKKTFEAFDFEQAVNKYDLYMEEKASKESEKARLKAKKIESDQKTREEKAKAE